MHLKWSSSRHEIVASGSVISFNKEPLHLVFALEGEDLEFIFTFAEDSREPDKPSLKAIPHGDRKLELQLVNFDHELGTGNSDPIEVGLLDGKNLLVNYRVYALSQSESRLLHYTFYKAK